MYKIQVISGLYSQLEVISKFDTEDYDDVVDFAKRIINRERVTVLKKSTRKSNIIIKIYTGYGPERRLTFSDFMKFVKK
jgi:hypothetical protein